MCNCQAMARDLSETMGGKYPASLHAPLCEDYKQVPFTRIEVDGSGCIVPESEAAAVIAGLGDEEYSVSTVHLTQDQFDRLPESAGF